MWFSPLANIGLQVKPDVRPRFGLGDIEETSSAVAVTEW